MRSIIYFFLSLFTFPFFLLYKNRVRIIAYHTISDKSNFEKQIMYISKNFNIISYHDLYQYLFYDKKLPDNALLISFDDGDRSVFEMALPILKKHQLPSIMFIISELINSQKPFWWVELEIRLGKKEGYNKALELKTLPNKKRLLCLEKLRNDQKGIVNQHQLTLEELKILKESGMEISNHSHTHPMLNQTTIKELLSEITLSLDFLSKNNFDTKSFAYPNGNVDNRAEELLKQNNIKLAFLFDHKINKKQINPLRISRLRVNADDSLIEFIVKVSGLHSFLLKN